jgi:hypothetical protein
MTFLLFAICYFLFGGELQASRRASLPARALLVNNNGREQDRATH